MDILTILLTVGVTVATQSVILVVIGNKFLKFAFKKVGEIITAPTLQKAFGILGGKSGEARRNKALENEVASTVLESTIGKFKPILGAIGLDLEDLIDRYGAVEVLGMANTFLPMLKNAGIDVSKMDIGNILGGIVGGGGQQGQGQQQPQTTNSQTTLNIG